MPKGFPKRIKIGAKTFLTGNFEILDRFGGIWNLDDLWDEQIHQQFETNTKTNYRKHDFHDLGSAPRNARGCWGGKEWSKNPPGLARILGP